MGFVQQEKAVRSEQPGMHRPHRVADAIAPEQKPRAHLIDGRAEDGWLGGRTGPIFLPWDAAPQAAGEQWLLRALGKPGQSFGDEGDNFGRRLGKRPGDLLGSHESVIDDDPAVDDEGDADRRETPLGLINLQSEMKNGDVQGRRLARSRGQVEDGGPFARLCDLCGQPSLPGKRLGAVDLFEKGREVRRLQRGGHG